MAKRHGRRFAWCVIGAFTAMLSACASTESTAGKPTTSSDYVQAFSRGEYQSAYDLASQAAKSGRTTRVDEAALIAGLSAHALNKNVQAELWLKPLTTKSEPEVSGKALATLGLIAQEQGDHESAAQSLIGAGKRLTGNEGARSAMYAGDSLAALGKIDDARKQYEVASSKVEGDGSLKTMIADRLAGNTPKLPTATVAGGVPTGPSNIPSVLTVQAGAFGSLSTAQSQAAKINRIAPARIVPIVNTHGQRLYAVRVGRFSNRDAAQRVRNQLGGTAIVTVATGE